MQSRFLLLALLLLVSTYVSNAQQIECRPAKIAFYVEIALGAKDGVARLYRAEERASDPGFVPNLAAIPLEKRKADYDRRRKILVEPIINELRSSIAEIARFNGLTIFEGVALDEHKFLLGLDRRLDITSQLIFRLGDASFKPGLKPSIAVPDLKVGVIDSRRLYGSNKGLAGFESVRDFDAYCASGKCKVLFDQLQQFTIERTYGAIFDSGRDLPENVRQIACYDATDQFIEYFNN